MTVSKSSVVANRAVWTKSKVTGVNVHSDGTVEDSMPYVQVEHPHDMSMSFFFDG